MLLTITHIEQAGRSPRARRLLFDVGDPRLTSASAVSNLQLSVGDSWEDSALAQSLADVEPELATERALRMLAYRERSRAELLRGLCDDGYPAHVAASVVSRMTDLGLVDDVRFAASWARTRAAAGYGRQRIAKELAERGIDPAIASAAVDDAAPPSEDLERARIALKGRRATTRAERERLIRRLVMKGFDLRTAVGAVAGRGDDDE